MKRRTFLLSTAAASGALLVGWGLMPPRSRLGDAARFATLGEIALNGWLRFAADGTTILAMPRAEMGQGVHTALVMLAAEELDVDPASVRLVQAPAERIFGNVATFVAALPFHALQADGDERPVGVRAAQWMVAKVARELGINVTGGSSSVADAWRPLRLAAASARSALVASAANRWKANPADCRSENGKVFHAGGQSAHYGELAAEAAVRSPGEARLKSRAAWRLLGSAVPRVDVPAKTNGHAIFGIDVRLPGMLYAAAKFAPQPGGTLAQADTATATKMSGVRHVVRFPADSGGAAGIAVVADTTWQAKQALEAMTLAWNAGPNPTLDSDRILADLETAVRVRSGFNFHDRGDVAKAFGAAKTKLEAWYRAPYLAHATPEPMNCTARVDAEGVELWVSTQVPDFARAAAARAAGVSTDRVRLHARLLGGGFGRRLEADVVAQATRIAMQAGGRPVQLILSREEDMRHDFYRPAQVARLEAAIDDAGTVTGWRIRSAGDAPTPRWVERVMPEIAAVDLLDRSASEGLFDKPYDFPHQRIEHVATRSGVPVGYWRSVGHSHNAFFSESFVDEIAHALKTDPVAFRRTRLAKTPRHLAVLDLAAARSGWGTALPEGRARGVALHESFGSIVAQVAEVSRSAEGRPRVHRVVCAIDCGTAINPGIIAQQMEGSVVFGLTAALYGRIDIRKGAVQQGNFPDYRLLGMAEAPVVETHIVPSTRPPAGVGEPGTPPIAPAVANAWFTLTGERRRALPL
ncbi:MAG TPA: molybdopterin cofactor-binding domain-containing protein [Burkholderiales bacterium]